MATWFDRLRRGYLQQPNSPSSLWPMATWFKRLQREYLQQPVGPTSLWLMATWFKRLQRDYLQQPCSPSSLWLKQQQQQQHKVIKCYQVQPQNTRKSSQNGGISHREEGLLSREKDFLILPERLPKFPCRFDHYPRPNFLYWGDKSGYQKKHIKKL